VVTTSLTAQARFAPAPLSVSSSASDVNTGQSVTFSTDASVHFRNSTLLGKSAEVRFTPLSTNWVLVGTSSVAAAVLAHRFDGAGNFLVSARVIYGVEYRLAGSANWVPSGEITVSGSVTVSVASVDAPASTPPSQPRALLVSKNCLARPTAFGCSP
jgi:hypothetical protein